MFKVGVVSLGLSSMLGMVRTDFEDKILFKWGRVVMPYPESLPFWCGRCNLDDSGVQLCFGAKGYFGNMSDRTFIGIGCLFGKL